MSNWQSIETVPRDGTTVWVADPDVGAYLMNWGHIQKNELFAPGTVGMWVATDGSFTWTEQGGFGPTRWAPGDAPMPPYEELLQEQKA